MKHFWLLTVLLLAVIPLARVAADSAAYDRQVLATPDLIGFWTFEDNFADQTASRNDAHPGGPNRAAVTFEAGVNGGRAVRVDNTSDPGPNFVEVNTPIGSIFDQPKFTILFWAKNEDPVAAYSDNDWNSLVDRNSLWYTELWSGPQSNTRGQLLIVNLYNPANPGNPGTGQIGRYDVRVPDPTPFWAKGNEWHQYGLTYDGATVTSYFDGKKMLAVPYAGGVGPTAATPRFPPHGNYNLTWGAWQQNDDWFTGAFDDTAYFKRALTADEIQALYPLMLAKGPVVTGYGATNPHGAPLASAPPGAPVLILGSALGTTGSVSFKGLPATVSSWSPTEILVIVPKAPSYPFTGPVTVTTNGQTVSGPAFTITPP